MNDIEHKLIYIFLKECQELTFPSFIFSRHPFFSSTHLNAHHQKYFTLQQGLRHYSNVCKASKWLQNQMFMLQDEQVDNMVKTINICG